MLNKKVKLNKNGVNAKIKAKIRSDKKMREIGFTDHKIEYWYFFRRLDSIPELSFNLVIPKDGSDIKIDVLDEMALQTYDYQAVLENNPKFGPALTCREEVEEIMELLQKKKVLSGHKKYEYI